MRVFKNLFGKGDKIAASEIVMSNKQTVEDFTTNEGIKIPLGTDVFGITTSGVYFATNYIVTTLLNCPLNNGFRLEVKPTNSKLHIMQIFFPYSGEMFVIQIVSTNGELLSKRKYTGETF